MLPAKRRKLGRRGIVASEFALLAPAFFLIALACSDLVRMARARLRAEAVAVQIGQVVSQCRSFTDPGDRLNFGTYAQRIAGNVIDVTTGTAGGAVIISAVGRNNNANQLYWQMRVGSSTASSVIGSTVNGTASISNSFVVPAGQALMVTEVFATIPYFPLSAGLIDTLASKGLYATTLFLSRAPTPTTLLTTPTSSSSAACTA